MQRTSAAQIYMADEHAINKHSINGMFDNAAFAQDATNAANINGAINEAAATTSDEEVDHFNMTPFAQSPLQQAKQAIINIINGETPGEAIEALQNALTKLSSDEVSTLLNALGPEFENRGLGYLWEAITEELELDGIIPSMSLSFDQASSADMTGDLVEHLKEKTPTPSILGKMMETLEKMRQGEEAKIKMDRTSKFDTPKPANAQRPPPAYMLAQKPPAPAMPAPAMVA